MWAFVLALPVQKEERFVMRGNSWLGAGGGGGGGMQRDWKNVGGKGFKESIPVR